jgi:CelD/BcsL family acetyltransferase involved in cellulose biosynthesis
MQFTKRRRTTVRQLYRKLFDERFAEIRLVASRDDLDEAWPLLTELHQKRQRSLRHAGCFSNPRFDGFLREAAERFLELGLLRLQWLTIGGRPAAAQLDFVGGDTQYHYLSGMEPELLAERPGRLGMLAMLHRAQAEGLRTYDFLRGDHRYKSDWLAEPTPIVEWRIAAATWRGRLDLRLTTANWRARSLAKRWLSRFRNH